MAKTVQLDVVSAEAQIFSGEVTELIAPGGMGDLGITPGHTQLITTLKRGGELRYKTEEGETTLFVAGGILEVQPHKISVLADTVVREEDLDEEAALEAVQRAEDLLEGKDPADLDYESIHAELDAAKAQIQMIHRIGKTLK